MDLEESLERLERDFRTELEEAQTASGVEQLRIKYLGRKGPIQELMSSLRGLDPSRLPEVGRRVNGLKKQIEEELLRSSSLFFQRELEERLSRERLDVTLPGRRGYRGRRHPVLGILDEILEIFKGLGFAIQLGPDIDTDYYNFEALNFAKDHPARDMVDTFYLERDILLRTHTSNTQVRVMEAFRPPIRVVAPGKCYRNEDVSARSHVLFHQYEGVYIDEGVSFGDLLGTLREFYARFFGREVGMRFRPSYFPFVEPGVEVDIECFLCGGSGCMVCKHSGFLEVVGAGMIHPEVLRAGGLDPERYQGYAWGGGIERLVMLLYGISDIRYFFENDERFLRQF